MKTCHQNPGPVYDDLDDIKTEQLQWYGHGQWMDEEDYQKELWNGNWSPEKRGKPKLTGINDT